MTERKMTEKNLIDSLQEFLVPRLGVLEGKIDAVNARLEAFRETTHAEFRRLDQRMDSLADAMEQRFDSLDQRMTSFEHRFDTLERRMDSTIALHERIAAIEAKIGLIH